MVANIRKFRFLLNALSLNEFCCCFFSMSFDIEEGRWLFYDSTYKNIEQLLRGILHRASKSKEDKERTLAKLFDLLETFANRSIGKRFAIHEVCNSRQEIIKAILDRTNT